MIRLVDIVNFNADASCLSASDWLAALKGGSDSRLCRWLLAYVDKKRPVIIGFTGATVADMAMMNHEAIDLVNEYPDTFEVILRPFSHDIALLRSRAGFALNVDAGRRTIEKEFRRISPYFLPAEFMLTNGQVYHLARSGVRGTFVNPSRFKSDLRSRIPTHPYLVRGIFSSQLRCIPIQGDLNEAYLQSIHLWDVVRWNQTLRKLDLRVCFSWRDGESFLFVPDGIERERAWLHSQSVDVERAFLSDVESELDFREPDEREPAIYRSYPVHSFSDWIKEFRMLGYLDRLLALESKLDHFDIDAKALWFQVINSDVFSAVEKDSPVVTLRTAPPDHPDSREISWTIRRSERGFEGEEFLEMLAGPPDIQQSDRRQLAPHLEKLQHRRRYLDRTLQ